MAGSARRLTTPHDHVFLGEDHARNERRTWIVIGITAAMMVVEIVAGAVYGSMALVADGWHMATHAGALLIAALAYRFARRHARDERFTFGTGKLGDLAAFASAVILAVVALLIAWESLMRLRAPVSIDFAEAMGVAVAGLVVNLVCAWLLKDDHAHHHGHHHGHGHVHGHGHSHGGHHQHHHDDAGIGSLAHLGHDLPAEPRAEGRDNNLRAAYLHVLTDALTSVLAIVALLLGAVYGWMFMDPLIGLLGSVVIARWSWSLIRDAGAVLIDYVPPDENLPDEIRRSIETVGDRITDLHVWRLGPGHHGAIISVRSQAPREPGFYRGRLAHLAELSHVTVEVERMA